MLTKLIVILLKAYKLLVSPFLTGGCRFQPTCSEYAKDAFQKRGFFIGLTLTFKRVIKCNPWGASGYDPVPNKENHNIECCSKKQAHSR